MAYCKVGQAEIYYEDIGEGTPILMIHGFTPDHRLMSGCMEPVFRNRDGWRRIYIDLPGMGLTKNYHEISSSDDMLHAVAEFIQEVIPTERYLIAGESYGGYIARGMIEKEKEQILGAAFICPVIVPDAESRTVGEHRILKRDAEFIEGLKKAELEEFQSISVKLDEYNWLRYNKEIVSGCQMADEEFLSKIKNNYGFSFEFDHGSFDRPSVFLLGRQDSVVGFQDALSVIDKFPRGTFAVMDIAGHNLQIEQPELFNTFITEWLDRVAEDKR